MKDIYDGLLHLASPLSPVSGMVSDLDASQIGPSNFALIENMRSEGAALVVRGGSAEIYAAPSVSSGEIKGTLIHPVHGAFVGIWDPAAARVKIFRRSGGAWTELTDATTRFATNADISMAVVQTVSPTQAYMVAQNGTDSPRVFNLTAFTGAVQATLTSDRARAQIYYAQYHTFRYLGSGGREPGTGGVTLVNTGAGFVGTAANNATQQEYAQIDIDTAVTFDSTSELRFASTNVIDWSTARSMHILFDCAASDGVDFDGSIPDIWFNIKIEASVGGAGTVVLYDPTDATYERPVIVENSSGKLLAAFKLKTVASANYNRVMLTWKAEAQDQDSRLNIYAIMASTGTVRGGTSFALSYTGSAQDESPSYVAINEDYVNAQFFGAPLIDGMDIPVSQAVTYAYVIRATAANSAVYSQEIGASQFYKVTSSTLASDQILITSPLQTSTLAPGGLHVGIPTAPYVAAVGSRLFCWGGSLKEVWFSRLENPFRFRQFLEYINGSPDIAGAATITMQGEMPQAVVPMSGAYAGAESVLIWTDSAVYRADGAESFQLTRPRRIAPFGTKSPRTIATYANEAFWLDTELQVRSLSSVHAPISALRIKNALLAMSDSNTAALVGAIWNDSYYLSVNGGSGNTEAYVWDIRYQGWFKYTLPVAASRMESGFIGRQKLFIWSSAGRLIEFDKPASTELGSNIAIHLRSGDYTNGFFMPIACKRVGMVSTVGSGSLTVQRITRDGTASPTNGVMSLSSTTTRETGGGIVWRYDQDASGNPVSHRSDWGFAVDVTGTVAPGFKMLALVAEVDTEDEGGADVS